MTPRRRVWSRNLDDRRLVQPSDRRCPWLARTCGPAAVDGSRAGGAVVPRRAVVLVGRGSGDVARDHAAVGRRRRVRILGRQRFAAVLSAAALVARERPVAQCHAGLAAAAAGVRRRLHGAAAGVGGAAVARRARCAAGGAAVGDPSRTRAGQPDRCTAGGGDAVAAGGRGPRRAAPVRRECRSRPAGRIVWAGWLVRVRWPRCRGAAGAGAPDRVAAAGHGGVAAVVAGHVAGGRRGAGAGVAGRAGGAGAVAGAVVRRCRAGCLGLDRRRRCTIGGLPLDVAVARRVRRARRRRAHGGGCWRRRPAAASGGMRDSRRLACCSASASRCRRSST